ncbi:hypothetical protein HGH93_01895 [Chitinophaga polysaccharea]|uniref:hypothetical protein n=1 Tax=Chitinophaga TaxID=79328 RepID=UPI0014554AC9|nr:MULTISPECIES: hypothetical protein [Chitinophaga]NLR56836.1 hypothetical protein [Chitinophaga polysaccharea]NLU93059.1 hypothetical protein [Chitinophaga sp. Ak27]
MQLYINETSILQEIQHKFSIVYPHLRLQFYKNPHDWGAACPEDERLTNNLSIDEACSIPTAVWIDIGEKVITGNMEQSFYDLLGLSVQVFRKAGDAWIQTTSTDVWTLGQQEAVARQEYNKAKILVR